MVRTRPLDVSYPSGFQVLVEPPLTVWCEEQSPGKLVVRWAKPLSVRDIVRYTVRYSPLPEDPEQPLNASYVEYADV